MLINISKLFGSLVFFCLVVCQFAIAQQSPKTYVANTASDTIVIDGLALENSWSIAPWTEEFIDIEGEMQPRYPTRMKMLWDANYLYFFAELTEPHVWATLKQRDTVIFYNNDFEIFIDPDGDTHNYYEFEINALNTAWDLFLSKPYRNRGKVLDSWDIQGLKTAVNIQGTLNDPSDTDLGWSVEIAIPWAVLTEASSANAPPRNQFWRINFSRVNWDFDLTEGRYSRKKDADGNFLPEYNWVWSPQWVINMHEPEHWGYVYFSEQPADKTNFRIPDDEAVKWFMYKQYRKLLAAEKKGQQPASEMILLSKVIQGEIIKLSLQKHLNGWTLSAESPFSGDVLMITEDGEFKTMTKH